MASHPSRYSRSKKYARVLYTDEERHAHSHDFNEAQEILEARVKSVADVLMSDGDIVEGCSINVNAETGVATLSSGRVYADGIIHDIAATTLTLPAAETVSVGILVASEIVTYLTDTDLKGFAAGTHAYGEPGEDRLKVSAAWARDGLNVTIPVGSRFFAVYTVINRVVLTQTPPPAFEPINNALARYDRENNGHYIVNGWRVTPRGLNVDDEQVFSIQEGTINVWGYKLDRLAAYPLAVEEDPDLEEVEAEPHVVAGGHNPENPLTIILNKGPIATVDAVTVLRQVTETLTHGPYSGITDPLGNTSVAEIVSVTQGGTTYTLGVDFVLTADQIDWAPAGAEPSPGSTYVVVYRYLDVGAPVSHDRTSITIAGATPGSTVLVRYHWKLPRIDVITVDRFGVIGYVRGLSNRYAPTPPMVPNEIFAIAEVTNVWGLVPTVVNTSTRTVHTNRLQQFGNLIDDLFDLVAQERLRRDMDRRDVVAKRGLFVDPFRDDDMRDAGQAQTASIVDETLRLPIAATVEDRILGDEPFLLAATNEVVVRQELRTGALKINEYQVFEPLPPALELEPTVDFWTEHVTSWTSDVSFSFLSSALARGSNNSTEAIEEVLRRREEARTLRVRDVDFTVRGLGAGEILESLTFDGVDVTPTPALVANGSGVVSGTFEIPAGLTTGSKQVAAQGAAGLPPAIGTYVGTGIIDTRVMRRVFTTVIGTGGETQGAGGGGGGGGNNDRGRGGNNRVDPLAQTLTLDDGRHITSVDVHIDTIGLATRPVVMQIREVRLGVPTDVVMAEAILAMTGRTPGSWVTVPFRVPVFIPDGVDFAIVFLTDDGNHKLSIGELGEFDAALQRWVTAQPYSVGVLLTSSNAATWTPHQKADLTFRLRAARFTQTQRIVDAGDFEITDCTDLVVLAAFELPAADTSVTVEITRENGDVILAAPGQPVAFSDRATETIGVRLILRGTALHSPVLYPFVTLVQGSQAASGTYISRAMLAGTDSRVLVTVDALLPGGSSLAAAAGQNSGNFGAGTMTLINATPLGDGWTELTYELEDYDLADARVRLTLTGTAAARPRLRNLRALVTETPPNITP